MTEDPALGAEAGFGIAMFGDICALAAAPAAMSTQARYFELFTLTSP